MDKKIVLTDLDAQLKRYDELRASSQHDDLSDLPEVKLVAFLTQISAAIARYAPKDSTYRQSMDQAIKTYGASNGVNTATYVGIVHALRSDYDSGYLTSIEQLLNSAIFADFLEMAKHLLDEGYKDPAAVLIGGVLEEHVRKLCAASNIQVEVSGRPKKTDALNAELAASGKISKLDQKNITAWLDLRNKSAHGKYGEYTSQQVELLLQSVQDFLTRVPV